MTQLHRSIQRIEYKVETKLQRFMMWHPFCGFMICFVAMPMLVLACVCVMTMLLGIPLALLLGWL